MTLRLRNPRANGRRTVLTREQGEALAKWHESIVELGTLDAALALAKARWRQRRRALGYAKNKADEYGICVATLNVYVQRLHKLWKDS